MKRCFITAMCCLYFVAADAMYDTALEQLADIKAQTDAHAQELFTRAINKLSPDQRKLADMFMKETVTGEVQNDLMSPWTKYINQQCKGGSDEDSPEEQTKKLIEILNTVESLYWKATLEAQRKVYDASRPPKNNLEKKAAEYFKLLLGEYNVDEVRLMDEKSLIFAQNIPSKRKNELLHLVEHGDLTDIYPEVENFVEGSVFANQELKSKVRRNIFDGVKASDAYKNTILVLIAQREAGLPYGDYLDYVKLPWTTDTVFLPLVDIPCHIQWNRIYMNYDYPSLVGKTFFDSGHSIGQNDGFYLWRRPKGTDLFSGLSIHLARYFFFAFDGNTRRIADKLGSRSIVIKTDEQKLYNVAMATCENNSYTSASQLYLAETVALYLTAMAASTAKGILLRPEYSDIASYNALFQTFGLIFAHSPLFSCNVSRNVLYINLLGNISASIEAGLPITGSHLHGDIVLLKAIKAMGGVSEFSKDVLSCFTKCMNEEFYKALFWANGSTMEQYKKILGEAHPMDSLWISNYTTIQALKKMYSMSKTLAP
jgi:hypothetical protein